MEDLKNKKCDAIKAQWTSFNERAPSDILHLEYECFGDATLHLMIIKTALHNQISRVAEARDKALSFF